MSKLWAPTLLASDGHPPLQGDTLPAMFWNAVDQRGPLVWMRQKTA